MTKSLNTNTDWVTITVTVIERSSGKIAVGPGGAATVTVPAKDAVAIDGGDRL